MRYYEKELFALYSRYNRREYVHPDPLEFLYDYDDIRDREIVGLIAACLAYGSVHQILKTVAGVLQAMGSPYDFVMGSSRKKLRECFADFKYRFTTGAELADLLYGVQCVLKRHGSLRACFENSLRTDHETLVPALCGLARELSEVFDGRPRSLLPSPEAGSACKRFHLFLRWMIRKDDVDPGGWHGLPPSKLIVPVDIHMHRLSRRLGLTARKQANAKTALEITEAFRRVDPDDPVRFDFCLTRLGIRDDTDLDGFITRCCVG